MKKIWLVILTLGILLGLSGCGNYIKLEDTESDEIAEYMAGLILRYNKNYNEALLSPTPIPSPSPTPTPTPTLGAPTSAPGNSGNGSGSSNIQANADFTEVIGKKGITIEYTGYKLYDSYKNSNDPEGIFDLSAEGKKVLVVSFDVKNSTDKKQMFTLIDSDIQYQLDVNVEDKLKPWLTMLKNDLRVSTITVDANGKTEAVLVFGVEDTVKIKTLNLIISNKSIEKTAIIKLK